jgi:Tol biopolymer transport system component/DNA-binding winged helix-turn-helix (wHTH) protein
MESCVYEFADVRVDAPRFQVLKKGQAVQLEPKALEVLVFLIEHRDRLVLKEELLDAVWPGTFVTQNALTRVVAQLRKALGDDAQQAWVIETVPRKGYRFLPSVTIGHTAAPAPGRPHEAASPAGVAAGVSRRLAWRFFVPVFISTLIFVAAWSLLRSDAPEAVGFVQLEQVTNAAGYESSPSLSPDGRRLAYTSDDNGSNEIYVRPLGDGNRIQITADGGQNDQAAWCPDGEHIAYHSAAKGGIWVVPATGGAARQIAEIGSEPAWSPDGSTIAFTTYEGALAERATIVSVPVAGGPARPLTRAGLPRGGHRAPAWSRDGGRLAFYAYDGARGVSLWVMTIDGGRTTRIADGVFPLRIAFTPDDRSICWSGAGPQHNLGLWCTKVDDGPSSRPTPVLQGVPGISGLSIAADGTVAYSVHRMTSDLWSVPLGTSGLPSGDPAPLVRDASRNTHPEFSPDGNHLAFLMWRPGTASDLWVMNMKDLRPELLAPGKDAEFYPTWTPDGRHLLVSIGKGPVRSIARVTLQTRQTTPVEGLPPDMSNIRLSPDGRELAYHVTTDSGGMIVWRVGASGGEPVRLTPTERSAGYPAWSPDGRRLAVEFEDGGGTQIWLVNRDGSGLEQLTTDAGQHWPHSWSPDNDRIVFAGERGGVWNLWTVSASTRAVRQLTRFSGPNGFVRYPAWSPRGDRIVFEHSVTGANIWSARLSGAAHR